MSSTPSSKPRNAGLLVFIVLFGFMARAATYKTPLVDHHAWRQADTASIARNFLRERFNIFYPQVDQRGGQATGYVETGLELFAFIVAAISVVAGFHHETGRVLSALLFVGSCLLVWTFVRRRYGDRAGLVGAFLYAFGFPLALYIERSFMNESLLIFLSLASLVAAQRVAEQRLTVGPTFRSGGPSGGPHTLGARAKARASIVLIVDIALIVATSLIATVKLPYLVIWAPIAGLFIERDGWRALRRWELWMMGAVNVAAAVAWYRHADAIGASTGLSFGMGDKLLNLSAFSFDYPVLIIDRLFTDVLGPIAFLAVLCGAWVAWTKRLWCELLGVAGFIVYAIVVAEGNKPHDYYQLVIMPTAPMLATLGVLAVSRRIGGGSRRRTSRALVTLLALAATSTFVRSVGAHGWYEYDAADVELCRYIAPLSAPDDRIVIVGDGNPWLLFCLDRKGWLIQPHEATNDRLRDLWQQGARLVIAPRPPSVPQPDRLVLEQNGTTVLMTDRVIVDRLR